MTGTVMAIIFICINAINLGYFQIKALKARGEYLGGKLGDCDDEAFIKCQRAHLNIVENISVGFTFLILFIVLNTGVIWVAAVGGLFTIGRISAGLGIKNGIGQLRAVGFAGNLFSVIIGVIAFVENIGMWCV